MAFTLEAAPLVGGVPAPAARTAPGKGSLVGDPGMVHASALPWGWL